MKDKIKESIMHWKYLSGIKTGANWNCFVDGLAADIESLFPRAGEDGLVDDCQATIYVSDGRGNKEPVIDRKKLKQAQKALDDKRWIEEIKGFGTTEVLEKEDKDNYMAYLVPTEFLKTEEGK